MIIRHVEIVTLNSERGLVILVSSSGRVDQRPVELGGASDPVVADLRGRLNAALVGLTPAKAVDRLTSLLDELPPEVRPLGAGVIAAMLELATADPSTRVVVGGVPNLTRFSTSTKPRSVRCWRHGGAGGALRLLGEVAGGGDVVTVRIGHENPYEPLRASVVASGMPGRHLGHARSGRADLKTTSTMAGGTGSGSLRPVVA